MGNYNERVGRPMVVLEVPDRHPEEPGSQRLETLILLGDRKRGTDLARALEEANEVLNLSSLLLVVLEMRLNLLNLLECALESLEILIPWLGRLVVGCRRWRSRGKRAAFGNEVAKLRLVLPCVHGVNDLLCDQQMSVRRSNEKKQEQG